MTIQTCHGVNIVGTFPVKISGIHGFHITAATGHRRVTGQACGTCIVGVPPVAGPATQPFMYSCGGPVILSPRFVSPVGSMALHAESLNRIIGHQHRVFIPVHIGFSEQIHPQVQTIGSKVVTGKGVPALPLVKYGCRLIHGSGMIPGFIFHMDGVTGQTGNDRLIVLIRFF